MTTFNGSNLTLKELSVEMAALRQHRLPTAEEFAQYLQLFIDEFHETLELDDIEGIAYELSQHICIAVYDDFDQYFGEGYNGKMMVVVGTMNPHQPETFIWRDGDLVRLTPKRAHEAQDFSGDFPAKEQTNVSYRRGVDGLQK